MLNWAPENQPELFIKGSELAAMMAALILANPTLAPAYITLATAYDLDRQLRARLASLGCASRGPDGGARVIEGGQQWNT